ncbi:GNAT family N-acetyltransferase [Desulfobacterales bacterium HSG16]|nr:GNAT family N-acetyltransferase [Desulfobacterales bacterium HSG16]
MDMEIKFECSDVDWQTVSDTLKLVGMAFYEPDLHKKAFENSQVTVFIYHKNRMIGFGRAISDGAYQAAVYDVAVIPEFQKMGLGKTIMENIMSRLPSCNMILYATPGKEVFYEKLDFRKMKTGMARFNNPEKMKEKGFTE